MNEEKTLLKEAPEEAPAVCTICGREMLEDEGIPFEGEVLCQQCYDELVTTCDNCGDTIWTRDAESDGRTTLCANCFDYDYRVCERCGRFVYYDEATYIDDCPFCDDCYEWETAHAAIHAYDYKPEPFFFGDGKRYFGVELEIDINSSCSDDAGELLDVANYDSQRRIYIKHDGSLNYGFEIVTHPMTLDYHQHEMPWRDLTAKALELGYRSHETQTCGLHIHVNRTSFGETCEEQDKHIGRILAFIENHWAEVRKFSRRNNNSINQWAARYGSTGTPKKVLDCAKNSDKGRYTCVNLQNLSTIEFRIFRGTLKYNTIIATLQFVDILCELANSLNDEIFSEMGWFDFLEYITPDKYPELIVYLKERQLYKNESILTEEEK